MNVCETEMEENVARSVKILFQDLAKKIQKKIDGEEHFLEYESFARKEFLNLFEVLYKTTLPISSQDNTYILFQEDLLVEFLNQQQIHSLDHLIRLHDGFHLLADWLHSMFYHHNNEYLKSFSKSSIVADYLFKLFLDTNGETIISLIGFYWEKVLVEKETISPIMVILEIFRKKSCLNLEEELKGIILDKTLSQFRVEKEKDYISQIVDFVEWVSPLFLIDSWNTDIYSQFLDCLKDKYIKSSYSMELWSIWVRCMDTKQTQRWRTIYKFIDICDDWIQVRKKQTEFFFKKWETASIYDIRRDFEFQQNCIHEIKDLFWKNTLEHDLTKLFQTRPALYKDLIERLQEDMIRFPSMESSFFSLVSFCKDKELFVQLYQEKMRDRLIGFHANPDISSERSLLKTIEPIFGKSSLLNLYLMINEIEKHKEGHVKVFMINKIAWGLNKSQFSHISIPSFSNCNLRSNSIKVEHIFEYGHVWLEGIYSTETKHFKMYPIQAVVLLSLDREQRVLENIEEVYIGLQKDGFLVQNRNSGVWEFNPIIPTLKECSRWEDIVSKKNSDQVVEPKKIIDNYHMDAFIVRHMKHHRSVSHESLMNVLTDRFPEIEEKLLFKQRIHDLIGKDYIQRSEQDQSIYEYVL